MNRIDPSGNCWVFENGDGVWYPDSSPKCFQLAPGKIGTPPLDGNIPEGATYVQSYGGEQLWKIYLSMKTCADAWWTKGEDKFDVKTLIGLMILSEANFTFSNNVDYADIEHEPGVDDRTKALVTVAATNLYYGGGFKNWKCDQAKQGNCLASAMNYWAGYSQVTRDMILDYYQARGVPAEFDEVLDDWLRSGPVSAGGYSKKNPQPQFYEILREAHRLGAEAFKPYKWYAGWAN